MRLYALYQHLLFESWSIDFCNHVSFLLLCDTQHIVILFVLGVRSESFDDSRPNTASTTASMASSDAKSYDQEDEIMSQKITIGVSEILSLLRTLGEGCRLSYMYKCQVRILLLTEVIQR